MNSSSANRTADNRTGGTCQFGGGTATSCAFSATKTLNDFDTSYPSAGVGALNMGALNTGVSRYVRIYLTLPSTAGNDLQGRQATFGFSWAIAQ